MEGSLPVADDGVEDCIDCNTPHTLRPRRKSAPSCALDRKSIMKKVRLLVAKNNLSDEEQLFLLQHHEFVSLAKSRARSYSEMKERQKEVKDSEDVLREKCQQLSDLIRSASHVIVYTGAGISTSADIPDYRGENGVWTKLKSGQTVVMGRSIVLAEPTYSHMCINELIKRGYVKYVLSQNCDGLHIRSGLPPHLLAEIHGNMFTEICPSCSKTYYRVFDVTENTGLRRHKTGRTCDDCHSLLTDTIVHFGEKSYPSWPHNWDEASSNADEADLILCLGTSLKVLRSYKQLWAIDRPKSARAKLVIVNLQWTPKDKQAVLKINGLVDDVLARLLKHLELTPNPYIWKEDSLIRLATSVKAKETESFHTYCIPLPAEQALLFPESSSSEAQRSINAALVDVKDEDGNADEDVFASSLELHSTPSLITPSWFGKGCRKSSSSSKKRRRKSKQSS